jgi:hypothetical protein
MSTKRKSTAPVINDQRPVASGNKGNEHLSSTQEQTLRVMAKLWVENGNKPPSLRQISAALGLGNPLGSNTTVQLLRAKGYVGDGTYVEETNMKITPKGRKLL